jgi:hypothetical protein
MRRLRILGLCVVAALSISVVAVASASAEAPEYGRCIKKAGKASGEGYSNGSCTTAVSSGARYEWAPGPGAKNKFSSVERFIYSGKYNNCSRAISEENIAIKDTALAKTARENGEIAVAEKLEREAVEHQSVANEFYGKSGVKEPHRGECEVVIETEHAKAPAELETVGGTTVTCGGVTSEGEYSGLKTVSNLKTTFTDCEGDGFKCTTSGAETGEIETSALQGELGVIEKENPITKAKPKIGLDLAAAAGANVTEFSCGVPGFEIHVVVTGSVIHQVKADAMVSEETETFTQNKGKQKPEAFEGASPDVLETSIGGGTPQQSGMTLRGTLTNEESIEVNAVV